MQPVQAMHATHATHSRTTRHSVVNRLPTTPTLPAVPAEPATATLPAVAAEPATATLPAVATEPATATLPPVATDPATATLSMVAIEPTIEPLSRANAKSLRSATESSSQPRNDFSSGLAAKGHGGWLPRHLPSAEARATYIRVKGNEYVWVPAGAFRAGKLLSRSRCRHAQAVRNVDGGDMPAVDLHLAAASQLALVDRHAGSAIMCQASCHSGRPSL